MITNLIQRTCTVLVSLNKVQWLHFTGVVEKFVTSDVTFLLDSVYQKILKLVNFWLSYVKKIQGAPAFLAHPVLMSASAMQGGHNKHGHNV